jgi:hypothetical protein
VLLRPRWWLEERGARTGGTLGIAVPECGIDGQAEVLAIGPCPAVKPGRGRVVTGTFKHSSAKVIDLYVEGLAEPIGTTANHLFWSEDRAMFVRADALRFGERLRILGESAHVNQAVRHPGLEPVYNIEVHCDHIFHISKLGILVHNAGPVLRSDKGYVYVLYSRNPNTGVWESYVGSTQDVLPTTGGLPLRPNDPSHAKAQQILKGDDLSVQVYEVDLSSAYRGGKADAAARAEAQTILESAETYHLEKTLKSQGLPTLRPGSSRPAAGGLGKDAAQANLNSHAPRSPAGEEGLALIKEAGERSTQVQHASGKPWKEILRACP